MIEAICANSEQYLSYEPSISVYTGDDVVITTLTDDGIERAERHARMRANHQRTGSASSTYSWKTPDVIRAVSRNGPRS